MEGKDELIKVAKEGYYEYDNVEYVGDWKGWKVYEPFIINDDRVKIIGLPIFVLEKNGKIRLNKHEESLVILRHLLGQKQ